MVVVVTGASAETVAELLVVVDRVANSEEAAVEEACLATEMAGVVMVLGFLAAVPMAEDEMVVALLVVVEWVAVKRAVAVQGGG